MKTTKNAGSNFRVTDERAITRFSMFGRNGVFMTRGKGDGHNAVALFKKQDNRIQRHDTCMAGLYNP